MQVLTTKEFRKGVEKYIQNRKSLGQKLNTIKEDIECCETIQELIKLHNIKQLYDSSFRLKIPPFRIIFRKEKNKIILINFIKRKGDSDYKKY